MDTGDCGLVYGASVGVRFMGDTIKCMRVCCAAPVFCVRFCMLVCDNVCDLCAHGCYRFADAVLFLGEIPLSVCAGRRTLMPVSVCVGGGEAFVSTVVCVCPHACAGGQVTDFLDAIRVHPWLKYCVSISYFFLSTHSFFCLPRKDIGQNSNFGLKQFNNTTHGSPQILFDLKAYSVYLHLLF